MNAIRIHQFGGPEVLRYEQVPDPVPAEGQILIRAHAIGVNPVETYIRAGRYGERDFPFIPGSDVAGIIEVVGPGVKDFSPHQRVYTAGTFSGAYAEKVLCTPAQTHRLPGGVDFDAGAALGVPYATAYRALIHRARAQAGETILVHGGSGGVGIAAIQIARAAGMRVLATAGTERGRKLILEQGAHEGFDHTAKDYDQKIMQSTGGRGVDAILEMLANVNLSKDLEMLATFGRIVVIGSRGKIEIDPRQTMRRDADIRGMILNHATPAELASIHAALIAGLENQTLRPVIGEKIPLAEASRAHERVIQGPSHGKIVLIR